MTRCSMCALTVVSVALALVIGPSAQAQRADRPLLAPVPPAPLLLPTSTWHGGTGLAEPTYAREGAVIGGVVVGALGAITAIALCGFDRECRDAGWWGVGGFAVGALAGYGVGRLIGNLFPKHRGHDRH